MRNIKLSLILLSFIPLSASARTLEEECLHYSKQLSSLLEELRPSKISFGPGLYWKNSDHNYRCLISVFGSTRKTDAFKEGTSLYIYVYRTAEVAESQWSKEMNVTEGDVKYGPGTQVKFASDSGNRSPSLKEFSYIVTHPKKRYRIERYRRLSPRVIAGYIENRGPIVPPGLESPLLAEFPEGAFEAASAIPPHSGWNEIMDRLE
jgi:hypothetical protein